MKRSQYIRVSELDKKGWIKVDYLESLEVWQKGECRLLYNRKYEIIVLIYNEKEVCDEKG